MDRDRREKSGESIHFITDRQPLHYQTFCLLLVDIGVVLSLPVSVQYSVCDPLGLLEGVTVSFFLLADPGVLPGDDVAVGDASPLAAPLVVVLGAGEDV